MYQSNQIWHLVSPWHHPCCCIIEQCSGLLKTRWSYNITFSFRRWGIAEQWIYRIDIVIISVIRILIFIVILDDSQLIGDCTDKHSSWYNFWPTSLSFKIIIHLSFHLFIRKSSKCIVIVIIMGDALLIWESKGKVQHYIL